MKNIKSLLFRFLPGLVVGFAIALFLSGKISEYPKGTRERGIIGVVGVAIILLASFLSMAPARYLQKKGHTNNPLE